MTDDHELDDLLRASNPVPPTEDLEPALGARVVARAQEVPRMQQPTTRRPRRRLVLLTGAAAAAVVVVAAGVVALGAGDEGPARPGGVALGGSNTMTSCIAFSVEQLARAPIAFDGTVTEIDEGDVTLDVRRWYRGGEGDTVTVHAPDLAHAEALVGAVGFEVGERYLISADRFEGRIVPAVCGFSVTYGDDMADAFEQAFG